jgi:hypothetical protein
MQENVKKYVTSLGSKEYRDIAEQLVEKSLVLVKMTIMYFLLKAEQKYLSPVLLLII